MIKQINYRELFIVYSTGLFITIFAGLFFHIRGYPNVVTATKTLDIVAPLIYMIPIFLPYGILIGELIWIWTENVERNLCFLLFIECIIITLFSFIRYIIGIPFSGHTLILSFYILHQFATNGHKYPFRILIGFLVLFLTIIYKIFLWNDPITFFLGLILGIALWLPGFFYRIKFIKEKKEKIKIFF